MATWSILASPDTRWPANEHATEHIERFPRERMSSTVDFPAAPASARFGVRGVLYGVTLLVAACSLLYELLLAQTLAALLGDTVLRYSITIGCYLGALGIGAMLCGEQPRAAGPRLARVEVGLSIVGGAAVPLFYLLDGVQRHLYLSDGPLGYTAWAPVGFLACTHLVIVAIGLLSGFEIPLLLQLGREAGVAGPNRILAVDYFGALLASVSFPLLLLPGPGLFATGFGVALLNAVAALVVARVWARRARDTTVAACATAIALVGALAATPALEQHFLKTYYYSRNIETFADLLEPNERPDIEHYQSRYQSIDIVREPATDQWLLDLLLEPADGRPKDVWLYLDGEYQLFSAVEAVYHEWFVHGAIQARGSPPHHALVLGGGDGLVVREVLKYPQLERVVHVELDPEMLRLRREHPALAALNDGAYDDPRLETVEADAFEWIRRSDDTFDAIFIDMPLPKDYNLSKVYSREFYAAVRARLAPDGVLAVDAPDSMCTDPESDWGRYRSTLAAAGFRGIHAMVSRVHPETARARTLLEEIDTMTIIADRGRRDLSEKAARAALRKSMERAAARIDENEFILAFHSNRAPRKTWSDMGVPLRVFGPEQLPLAFVEDCPRYADASLVNSVVRPTLPRIMLESMRLR